jgi:hypothetical protein
MGVRTVGNLCVLGQTILMQEVKGATRGRLHELVLLKHNRNRAHRLRFSPSLLMVGAMNRERRREP